MNDPLANAELYIDPNTMFADKDTEMAATYWSDNGKYMAYAEAKGGSDWKTIYIKDVESGKNLQDELMWIKFSGASWSKDNKGFFYSRYEVPKSYLNKD
jgi:prolyl oligopeptidase